MQAQRPGDILVVDDNASFLSTACLALTRRRHAVVSCSTASEARHHLERLPFDVALCAQQLPDGDGRSLCHFIKTNAELQRVSVGLLVDALPEGGVLSDPFIGGVFGMGRAKELVEPDDYISRSVRPEELILRVQNLLRLRRYLEEGHNTLLALMAAAEGIEEQDKRARGHCKRLSIMAIELGTVLGCDEWQLTTLERAGYLHDIGKVSIPGAIMEKTEPLSPREMQIIQNHCLLGEKLCQNVAALRPVLPIIRHHHERANGTGYPDMLRGDEIPMLAQIFSIVDIYDALRMWRPYRPAMSETQAIEIMQREVEQGLWNARVFTAFIEKVLPGLDQRLNTLCIAWPQF